MRIHLGFCAVFLLSAACGSNNPSLPNAYGSIALESGSEGVTAFEPRAFFYKYTSSGTGLCDVTLNDGVCRSWSCNDDAYTKLPGVTVLDAGALSVSGAKRALEFSQDEKGYYAVQGDDGTPLWDGGEMLTATIGGSKDITTGTITITAPPPLTVTAPVIPEEGLVIDTTSDLPVSWTPLTTADSIYIALSAETDATLPDGSTLSNTTPGIDCVFSGKLGNGVVRAALLAQVPKPAGLKSYHLDILTFSSLQQRFGSAVVELRASWLGMSTTPTIK